MSHNVVTDCVSSLPARVLNDLALVSSFVQAYFCKAKSLTKVLLYSQVGLRYVYNCVSTQLYLICKLLLDICISELLLMVYSYGQFLMLMFLLQMCNCCHYT